MITSKILTCCFLVFLLAASMNLPAQEKKPVRVLIVDGFSNHDWKQTTNLTKRILEESKLFQVDVSTFPTDSIDRLTWAPAFKRYAVVIQNANNIQNKALRWPRKVELELETYVKNGGGLYILHSGNNAFPHWKEYDNMIGLGWRPKTTGYALEIDANRNVIRIPPGEGNGTNHGKRFDAIIQLLNRHPINMGYPGQWKTAYTEVYNYPRGPAENLTVLSYAFDSSSTQKMWPVEWVVKYGRGRVYNSSMGHLWKDEVYPDSYRCIGFQTTMIRVTQWLASGKVTYPVPRNFPGKDTVRLRDVADFPNLKAQPVKEDL
jgi:type 1 glutamine amidotransferase